MPALAVALLGADSLRLTLSGTDDLKLLPFLVVADSEACRRLFP
jgi:hypothetical protein